MAKEIAKYLGKKLVVKDIAFDSIINEVKTGKADFGAAGISYSDDRAKNVDFSINYAVSKQVVIVNNNSSITNVNGISNKKIAVQLGSIADTFVTEKYKSANVVRQKKYLAAIEDLKTGKVDCVVMDELPAKEIVSKNEGIKILDGSLTNDSYGMVVKKGNTLPVEVAVLKGKGNLLLTGQLGDVMKESGRAALTCIRTRSEKLKIDEKFYEENDIHVHFPEGAVPKDGPSAGITMTTAIVSALTGKKVRADVAMTGEITLRGKVLPIGGLKEKSLAAYREGIYTVIMPKANERDLDEIAPEVKAKMKFIPVETIDEVLKVALVD
ncbi:MAG: hypothetical protein EGS06_08600 [Megamonas funiformis]|nr:hypothetical protein [Megamonas funiformis]